MSARALAAARTDPGSSIDFEARMGNIESLAAPILFTTSEYDQSDHQLDDSFAGSYMPPQASSTPSGYLEEQDDGAFDGPGIPPHNSSTPSSTADLAARRQNLAARLVDLDTSLFKEGLSAITGVASAENLSFSEAVKRCGIKGVALNVLCASKHAANMKNRGDGGALTADHIAAIHLYTQACEFYRTLNACLRDRDRVRIKPFFPYLRLLLDGLRQLPAKTRTVYRGIKLDLSSKFRKGDQPVWWSVTSTSATMDVLQSKEFCGPDGPRTVFVVQTAHARDIAAFSAFSSEEELILLPGVQLQVKAVVALGGGLHLVQMDEIDLPMSLIEFEDLD